MLLKLLTTLCLLALYGSVFAADCYVWQREHTPYVKRAVKEFHNFFCGRLLYLAGEIENSGKVIKIPAPDCIVHGSSGAVVRIHVMEMKKSSPQKLAAKIAEIFQSWHKAGCDELQIDLDAPEKRLAYYRILMNELKKLVPDDVKLSATVLPCHLDHKKEFSLFAKSVDYFVLQVHYVQFKGKEILLFDKNTACRAILKAQKFRAEFKVALPLYIQKIRDNFIHCNWQDVADCAKFCSDRKIAVIGFRLGNTADRLSFDLETAQNILNGKIYSPRLELSWAKDGDNTYILYIKNTGFLYRKVRVQCRWKDISDIRDFDILNGTIVSDITELRFLDILLPFPGESRPVLWIKTSGKGNPELELNIISKEQ